MSTADRPCLPVELYRPIIEYVQAQPRSAIRRLSYLSRAWRYEVECIQYASVKVPELQLLFFCRTMHDRPDLARRVRKLSFYSAAHRRREPGDPELIKSTMGLLVNLKDLSILESRFWLVCEWAVTHEDGWILDDCPFKLERYSTHFSWREDLVAFLTSQPSLREFHHLGGTDATIQPRIPDHALQRCCVLQISPHIISGFRSPRNVSHLRVDMWFNTSTEERDMAKAICNFGGQLKVLALTRKVGRDEYLSTHTMLQQFVGSTQKLRCLAIYDDIDYSPAENKRIMNVIATHLKDLRVFIWAPLHAHPMSDDDIDTSDESGFSADTDDDETSVVKLERYAFELFKKIPSLDYFLAMRAGRDHGWHRIRADPTKDADRKARKDGHADTVGQVAADGQAATDGKVAAVYTLVKRQPSHSTLEDFFPAVNPENPTDYFLGPNYDPADILLVDDRFYLSDNLKLPPISRIGHRPREDRASH